MSDDVFKTQFGKEIFDKKYAGEFKGRPNGYYKNLAKLAALGDENLETIFADLLISGRFSPGGRILAYNGRVKSAVSLMNCTTHQVDGDGLDEISKTAWTIMKASSKGQGIGINLDKLRPRGAAVNNAAKTSTGAVSFMEMLNKVGETIGQEGRRAALLFQMSVSHPDLYRQGEKDLQCPHCNGKGCFKCQGTGFIPFDFLHIKSIPGKVESANISVLISDAFMKAVVDGKDWTLHFEGESGGQPFKVERTVKARELFMALAKNAWQAAEPGVLFEDTIHFYSNSDRFGDRWKVVGCNACSEMMLDQDGVCNLGSVNLSAYVVQPFMNEARFDTEAFARDVCYMVEFLDNINTIELSDERSISLTQLESIRNLRRVGLGVMGLHDALVMLGCCYGKNIKTEKTIRLIFQTLRDSAYAKSAALAMTKGPAGVWNKLMTYQRTEVLQGGFYATLPVHIKELIVAHGLRNTTVLSIAPTGSISNLLGVSSGIEPIFAREYVRRTRMNGTDEFITYVHPGVAATRALNIPDSVWETCYEVTPEDHIWVQALVQQYIDSSIAKTTNLPSTATPDDVAKVYMLAWRAGLKGITVYVDGSRDMQVLYQKEEGKEEKCPNCGTPLVKQDGCTKCPSCDYGKCE